MKRTGTIGRKAARHSGLSSLRIKRILVPLDFSPASHKALSYAVALATDMKAKIVLLHVVEPVYVNADPGLSYLPNQTADEERFDAKQMRKIAEESIPAELFEKVIVCAGTPYHEITTVAKRLKADLIVITTHGRTGLSHVLMGSTAERVVRHAPCAVLTVRRPE